MMTSNTGADLVDLGEGQDVDAVRGEVMAEVALISARNS